MPDSPPPAAALRVLVVDDNVDLADGLGWILEAEGCSVETANSGEQALAAIAGSAFDVVVLDFKLPGLSGFAARRAVARALPAARLVTMSGWSLEQLLLETLGAERLRVLRHPFPAESLGRALDALGPDGLLLVAGRGEESAADLAERLAELGTTGAWAADAAAAGAALAEPSALPVLDLERPLVETLDVYFELRESRGGKTAGRRILIHARPIAPDEAGDDVLTSPASTGIFVKPLFDFDDVLRAVRG